MESPRQGESWEVSAGGGEVALPGTLDVPLGASGVVLFAHGSGSGRHSPRNRYVAGELRSLGLATLLVDLLSESEAADRRLVFDIDLLATRLLAATAWLRQDARTKALRVGYFGASTGAAAALQAAARESEAVGGVVSRGGRPDLAAAYLGRVKAPTLLIVGGADGPVIGMNQQAFALLNATKELVIVPGAGHLFEEPGTLEDVARLAGAWFARHLARTA
ncbi:MAG: dienelactone hydrolase family protein [Chloroflexota bacterium]